MLVQGELLMTSTVHREELASLRDEWLALLEQQPAPAPFLHPTWHRVWLEEFQDGRDLLLLSVRTDGALLGIAPLLRDGDRLSFAGNHSVCDYMDFVVALGREDDFFEALLAALREESWSELDL